MKNPEKQDAVFSLDSIKKLPSLPDVVNRVLGLISSPRTTAKELGEAISMDPSLTTKILKIVNSPFYGFPGKISTIQHALVCLGFNTVRGLLLGTSVFSVFDPKKNTCLNSKMFWKHSVAVSQAGKMLGKIFKYRVIGECVVIGLLHDIGKLVIDQQMPLRMREIISRAKEENINQTILEKEILGYDHAEIGTMLFQKWNLPDLLVKSIRFHHMPSNADSNQHLISILHVSDFLVWRKAMGSCANIPNPPLDSKIFDILREYKPDFNDLDSQKFSIQRFDL
jgi:HD-like signal output (HDOD) protein